MTFEIQYKCYMGTRFDLEDGFSKFPRLKIRYRKAGKAYWTSLDAGDVDEFAFHQYRSCHYGEFQFSIGCYSDYNRLSMFQELLSKRFDGSMEQYVKHIVETEAVMALADIEESQDTMEMADRLLTGGWRSTTLELEQKREICAKQ